MFKKTKMWWSRIVYYSNPIQLAEPLPLGRESAIDSEAVPEGENVVASAGLDPGGEHSSGNENSKSTSDSELERSSFQEVLKSSVERGNEVASFSNLKTQMYRINTDDAPVVHIPHNSGIPVAYIKKESLVDVLGVSEHWVKVRIPGGMPAWGKSEDFILDNGEGVVLSRRARLRLAPDDSVGNPVLAILHSGFHATLLDQSGDWVKVLMPEWVAGWMEQSFLETIESDEYDFPILQREWGEQSEVRQGMYE